MQQMMDCTKQILDFHPRFLRCRSDPQGTELLPVGSRFPTPAGIYELLKGLICHVE